MLSSEVTFPKCVIVSKNYYNLTLPHTSHYKPFYSNISIYFTVSSNLPYTKKRSVNIMENIS